MVEYNSVAAPVSVSVLMSQVMLRDSMRPSGALATVMLLLLLLLQPAHAEESGTVIPAESETLSLHAL